MRRLIGALALLGVLTLAVAVPSASAQSFGPTVDPATWYGPLVGPYGGIGASGFGSTGYGCGMGGSAGFSNYGYGTVYGGPLYPQCGGFGAYPYMYPYYVGYPYASGVGAVGAIQLTTVGNPNPFNAAPCNAFALGSNFPGVPANYTFGGPAYQWSLTNNATLLNLTNPALSTLQNVGTLGTTNLAGCVALR